MSRTIDNASRKRRRRWFGLPVTALATGAAIAVAALGVGATPASASQSFSNVNPGGQWIVPAGVHSIQAVVQGAAGGGGSQVSIPIVNLGVGASSAGGAGSSETVTIPVTPGDTLDFYYGQVGGAPGGAHSPGEGGSGWAAGGNGNTGSLAAQAGAGGGGASAVVDATTGTTLVVAAGGGGGGGQDTNVDTNPAGNGGAGGEVGAGDGTNGGQAEWDGGAGIGTAGNPSGGPAGSIGLGAGFGLVGGQGGNAADSSSSGGGGGGGGGSYSGGGGSGGGAGPQSGGGGGGGASYVNFGAGVTVDSYGYNSGQGSNIISYTQSEHTSITVTPSSPSTVYGSSVTLTATVTDTEDGSQTPTGTLTLSEGSTQIGTATLDSSGSASFTIPDVTPGNNFAFTFTPSSGSIFEAAYQTYQQPVTPAPVTVTAVSSDPNATTADPPTINVQVTPQQAGVQGVPIGTVNAVENGQVISSAVLDSNGDASFPDLFSSAGTHNLEFDYVPSSNSDFAAGSGLLTQRIIGAQATVTATSSNPNATTANPPTITVDVAAQQSGVATPAGSVTAVDSGVTLGTVNLDSGGVATFASLVTAAGAHDLTFTYNPAANSVFASAAGTLTQVITAATVNMSTSSSNPSATTANPPTITVNVAPSQSGWPAPTGTVTASENGTTLSTAGVDGNGNASFPSLVTTAGTHQLTFTYNPASNSVYGSSSTQFAQTITAIPAEATVMTVGSNHHHPVYGGARPAFTVTVAAADGQGTPTGKVEVYEGAKLRANVALDPTGTASFSNLVFMPGQHDLKFLFIPAQPTLFTASNGSFIQTVSPAPVKLGTTARTHTVVYGSPVPITVSVMPRQRGLGMTPAGTITVLGKLGHGGHWDAKTGVLAVEPVGPNGKATFRSLDTGADDMTLTFIYKPALKSPFQGGQTQRYQVTLRAAPKLVLSTNDPSGAWHVHWPMLRLAVHTPHSGMTAPNGELVITRNGKTVKTVKLTSSVSQSYDVLPNTRLGDELWPMAGSYRLGVRFIPAHGSPYLGTSGNLVQKIL